MRNMLNDFILFYKKRKHYHLLKETKRGVLGIMVIMTIRQIEIKDLLSIGGTVTMIR